GIQIADPTAAAAIAVVIDTSQSMSGGKLDDAIAAARGFVDSQSTNNPVGIYGFGSEAYSTSPLTTDRTQTDTALKQLGISGASGTALYGALKMASSELATADAAKRIVVLLTDGASDHDSASLEEALATARDAKVQVYPIGIATEGHAADALARMADQTGGTYSSASSSADLQQVYDTIAGQMRGSHTITYQSGLPAGSPLKIA